MGKIIVKNIKGMGWKAKISLIAMFTLAFSVLLYQGWQQYRNAEAAVGVGTAWTNIHASNPNNQNGTVTSTGTFTAAAGTNRLLLVAVYCEIGTANQAMTALSATYGGVAVTQIATTRASAAREHVWLGYIKEASIPAGANTVAVTYNTGNATNVLVGLSVKAATYNGVDQGTPIVGSNANFAAGVTVATNAIVNYLADGMTVFAAANGGSPATQAITATPTLTTVAGATNTTNHSTFAGASAAHTGAGSYASGGVSITYAGTTSTRSALVAASLRPATTTLATGTDPAAATIAPGAAATDANTFTFQTGSAGTTEAITSITLNLSNNAGIARLAITDNANTELGFTTAPVTGSNTITVTGLTATNTLTTYKVRVTPLSHAAMPAVPGAAYAVTAPVTAWVGSTIHAGTDTDAAALTIDNLSPANPTGFSGTAGNNQVTLNWTNPPTDFSQVIVLRNTAAITDTPVEGVTYTSANTIGTSAVRYVGPLATFLDSTALNGTAYYYKIFAKDAYGNYSQTGVATGPITPISPDSVAPTVDAGFAATTPLNVLSVPITSFSATDNGGGSGIAAYLITTTSAQPAAGAAGWTTTPPTSYTVGAAGSYTLYPWAKDGGNNVSALYGAPVAVVVDQTLPTVSTFTATTPSTSRNIPVTFTAADTGGSGVAGYMITTSNVAPLFDDARWLATAPATFTVATDGSVTLYPWVKDGAGNVSLAFGTPRTVLVDTLAPTGLALISPADMATDQPTNLTLQSSTATDGSAPVQYMFQISNPELVYSQSSGWISGTSFAPTGLLQGYTYTWSVKARDGLGNETAYTTPRTFTTLAPCVRNNPTLTLLTPGGSNNSMITADAASSVYNLKVINNDFGSCGSSTFNLSLADTNADFTFDLPSVLSAPSVTLAPGAQTTLTVTVKATAGEVSGVNRTTVTSAADLGSNHQAVTTAYVQTQLNVVGCTPEIPQLIIGPDSGYVNKGGSFVYTVTVKNTDTGTGCLPITFNVTSNLPAETNTTDFNASTLSAPSITLGARQGGSLTLTVSAKSTAAKNAVNVTSIALTAAGHSPPGTKTATTTVNNPMLHNTTNTNSTKWSGNGGWGLPGTRYGEIVCTTCHVGGYEDTIDIKRIRQSITTPVTTFGTFPGAGRPVIYNRMASPNKNQGSLGFDSTATPRTSSTKICEVCHTYDATKVNGVNAHPYATAATLGNHYGTDGVKDCVVCHKHNKGFSASGMACNACHGDSTVTTTIDATNRYVAAPPLNASGAAGTLTGIGLVSNDRKVGAHQTHLRLLNGFSNYSTVDFRCQNCHGPVPTGFTHANGSSTPVFQGMASKGSSPTWNASNLTCSNTYCHNPAASGVLKNAVNTGSKIFPSWTGAKYVGDIRKTQANCGVCHKSPGDAGFQPAGTHNLMTIANTNCAGCHGHDGDTQGDAGQRHMDGIMFGGGDCDSCHGYQTGSWSAAPVINLEGKGSHEKHVAYLTAKRFTVTLNPQGDQYASAATTWTNVCGICHGNAVSNHMNSALEVTVSSTYFFGAAGTTLYSGVPGVSSATTAKTCSNINCHYFTTPLWSTY